MTTSRITCEIARGERPRADAVHSGARRHDVGALLHRAAGGDERAWTLLVGRFDATVRAVARRYGLSAADRDEVAQRTWLALHSHIGRVSGHPAIGGWLATTARHECLRVLAKARREVPVEGPVAGHVSNELSPDDHVLEHERRETLHRALGRVPVHERRLMQLLLRDSAPSYDEVSDTLGIPRGSIGPTRGRCIARLRFDRELAGLIRGEPAPTPRRSTRGHDLA